MCCVGGDTKAHMQRARGCLTPEANGLRPQRLCPDVSNLICRNLVTYIGAGAGIEQRDPRSAFLVQVRNL